MEMFMSDTHYYVVLFVIACIIFNILKATTRDSKKKPAVEKLKADPFGFLEKGPSAPTANMFMDANPSNNGFDEFLGPPSENIKTEESVNYSIPAVIRKQRALIV